MSYRFYQPSRKEERRSVRAIIPNCLSFARSLIKIGWDPLGKTTWVLCSECGCFSIFLGLGATKTISSRDLALGHEIRDSGFFQRRATRYGDVDCFAKSSIPDGFARLTGREISFRDGPSMRRLWGRERKKNVTGGAGGTTPPSEKHRGGVILMNCET